jgi:hypothetical protein
MHIRYFGDSYDIVKQSMIRWLSAFGPWAVHPMFTESSSESQAASFSAFLGASLITTEVLTPETDRERYFLGGDFQGNVFFDPDTGLRLKEFRGARAPTFLFAGELAAHLSLRPGALALVFDQSFSRGRAEAALGAKVNALAAQGVAALAYRSHACFVLAAIDRQLILEAQRRLLRESRLPESRFVIGAG